MSATAQPLALNGRAVHLVVDMQRLFTDETAWHVPDLPAIVAPIARLVAHRPARSLFSRFCTPHAPEHAKGHWMTYYRRWPMVTLAKMDPALLDLVPGLAFYGTPERIIDKAGYSAFDGTALESAIDRLAGDRLIVTGIETDVCVLATIFGAVDRGYRVIVPVDALASASREAHDAVVTRLLPRLHPQIELTTVEAVISAWH